jgi:hypothetical protein
MPPTVAAQFGNLAASQLITRFGARLGSLDDYRAVLQEFDNQAR